MYSSSSAKSNQPEVWPKLQNLLKLLLLLLNWTGSGCWKYKLCNLWVWFVIQYHVPHFFSQFQRLSFSNIGEMVKWCDDETEVRTKVVDGVNGLKYWFPGWVCCAFGNVLFLRTRDFYLRTWESDRGPTGRLLPRRSVYQSGKGDKNSLMLVQQHPPQNENLGNSLNTKNTSKTTWPILCKHKAKQANAGEKNINVVINFRFGHQRLWFWEWGNDY